MKGASRINKQIRKNIARLTDDRRDKSAVVSNMIVMIMVIFIAITIPFSALSISANLVFKNQDLYGFEFERSGMISTINGDISPAEMATQMVNFLSGKDDYIKAKASYSETYSDIFSDEDMEDLKTFRQFLDRILVFAIIFLIISAILFAMLFVAERKRELRKAFSAGGVVYIILVIVSILFAFAEVFREFVLKLMFGIVHASNSMIPIIFTGYYRAMAVGLIAIVAFIIFAIIYTIGSRFFKEHRMFEI